MSDVEQVIAGNPVPTEEQKKEMQEQINRAIEEFNQERNLSDIVNNAQQAPNHPIRVYAAVMWNMIVEAASQGLTARKLFLAARQDHESEMVSATHILVNRGIRILSVRPVSQNLKRSEDSPEETFHGFLVDAEWPLDLYV